MKLAHVVSVSLVVGSFALSACTGGSEDPPPSGGAPQLRARVALPKVPLRTSRALLRAMVVGPAVAGAPHVALPTLVRTRHADALTVPSSIVRAAFRAFVSLRVSSAPTHAVDSTMVAGPARLWGRPVRRGHRGRRGLPCASRERDTTASTLRMASGREPFAVSTTPSNVSRARATIASTSRAARGQARAAAWIKTSRASQAKATTASTSRRGSGRDCCAASDDVSAYDRRVRRAFSCTRRTRVTTWSIDSS
jgi:hypothetical protein